MKVLTTLLLLSLVMMGAISCGPKTEQEKMIQAKHDEIMVIHDEVMPKMKDIYKLKKKIKKIQQPESLNYITDLQKADDAMMDWMHQYKKPKADQEDVEGYLAAQLTSVKEMKSTMIKAISSAQAYIDQHSSDQ